MKNTAKLFTKLKKNIYFKYSLIIVPIVVFITFLLVSFNSYSQKIDVEWISNDIKLKGTLIIPKATPKSLAILIPGSGSMGRKSKWQKKQAEKIAKMGVAVFYYDKRGVGESEGDWKNATLDDYAIDVVSAIPSLLNQFKNKVMKVGFIGYSQGNWIMMKVRNLYPKTNFLVNVSGTIRTPEAQGRFVTNTYLSSLGYDNEIISKGDELNKMINEVYRTNSGWDETKKILDKYSSETWFKDGGFGLQPKDSWNWKWYANLPFDYNPKFEVETLTIPYLSIQGGKDPLVDAFYNKLFIEKLKKKGGLFSIYFDPEAAHLCQYKKSYWKDAYWSFLKEWFKSNDLL